MAVEMFSWPSLHERMCRTWGSNSGPLAIPSELASDRATAPGDNPKGHNFDVNRNLLSLQPFATSLTKISLMPGFIHVYSPGPGADNPLGTNFFISTGTSCHFGHLFASLKKILGNLTFIHFFFFHDFIHVYSPGEWIDSPRGQSFDINRNVLSLHSFVASLNKNAFEDWFYTFFFHDLIHVYSPGAGTESPHGTKVWCQQKGLTTLIPICCKFQRNLFEVWFYAFFFFSWFNTCI